MSETGQENQSLVRNFMALKVNPLWFFTSLAILSTMGLMCEYLASLWWVFDNLSCFKIQYTLALLLSILSLLLLCKKRKVAVIFIIPLLLSLITLSPFFINSFSATTGNIEYKIMQFNVLTNSCDYSTTAEIINREDPDILVLQEIDDDWVKNLHPLVLHKYPHQLVRPSNDNFGMSLKIFTLHRGELHHRVSLIIIL